MPNEFNDADWTMLNILSLILHRSTKQQVRAINTLLDLANKNLRPISISPLDLLRKVISPFTYSGNASLTFFALTQMNTPAADEALKEILRDSGNARNEDFRKFIQIAVAEGKLRLLKVLEGRKLSQSKATILRQALQKNEDDGLDEVDMKTS